MPIIKALRLLSIVLVSVSGTGTVRVASTVLQHSAVPFERTVAGVVLFLVLAISALYAAVLGPLLGAALDMEGDLVDKPGRQGFVVCWALLLDATRSLDAVPVRVVFLAELWSSWLIVFFGTIRPVQGNCVKVAAIALSVQLAFCAYLAIWRPYRCAVDAGFTYLLATIQLAMSVACVTVTWSKDKSLVVVALGATLQLGVFVVYAIVAAVVEVRSKCCRVPPTPSSSSRPGQPRGGNGSQRRLSTTTLPETAADPRPEKHTPPQRKVLLNPLLSSSENELL